MANYDNLIASIKDAIKNNNKQAITGQVLQDAMLEMVSQLGKNYAFGGLVKPSTNPGTLTVNTFYIATAAGTYSNFGGAVLSDGELAFISWNGEKWQNDKISIGQNNAVNTPDEEDITVTEDKKLKLKDRSFGDGMGYVILRKNKTFAEQVTKSNTIYEIRYDFDLAEGRVSIPDHCNLLFNGGSISNGSVSYSDTLIEGDYIGKISTVAEGSLRNEVVTPEMFGYAEDWTEIVANAIEYSNNIYFPRKADYNFDGEILIAKNGLTIDGGDSMLVYSGVGDFITIGETSTACRNLVLKNIVSVASKSNCHIKIVGAIECEFNKVDVRDGKKGFWYSPDKAHFYTNTFINCFARRCSEFGYKFITSSTSQVNNITMADCSAQSCGDGIVISGFAIRISGGEFAQNTRYGIYVDAYSRGLSIEGIYAELNGLNSVFVVDSADSTNITVKDIYDKENSAVFGGAPKTGYFGRNIDVMGAGTKSSLHLFTNKVCSVSRGVNLNEAKMNILGVRLPCLVRMKASGTVSGLAYLFTGIVFEGKIYNFIEGCEYRKVVSVSGNTVTFDKAVEGSHTLFVPAYAKSHPIVATVQESQLNTYKVGVCQTEQFLYDIQKEFELIPKYSGNTAGITTLTNSALSGISVGDYVCFFSTQRLRGNNNSSISGGAARDVINTVPSSYENLPAWMKDSLCVSLYNDASSGGVMFDYVAATTI